MVNRGVEHEQPTGARSDRTDRVEGVIVEDDLSAPLPSPSEIPEVEERDAVVAMDVLVNDGRVAEPGRRGVPVREALRRATRTELVTERVDERLRGIDERRK